MQALRSETVRARIAPELKTRAEGVFNSLGLSPSQAIVLFYRQVELHNGLPFKVVIPQSRPLDMATMSKEQFDAELSKGYNSDKAGRKRSVAAARADFVREFGG